MDEERYNGPDQRVPEPGEPRPEEPDREWPEPVLLQELAFADVTDGSEPIAGEEPDDEEEPDEVAARSRVRTSTKVVVVAAAWLLLTLFLVGRFSGGPLPEGSTRLDQAVTDEEDAATADGHEAADEVDAGDASAGESLAGDYADGAAIYGDGTTAGSGAGGGGSGVYAGVPADGAAGVGGGGAVPGAAPGASGPATSPLPAPGSGGGAATTTPPAGGGTTDTTAASGGGSGGTTTTTTAAAQPDAPAPAATIHISWNGNKFVYDRSNLSVPAGSVVRMVNDTAESHTWKMGTWNVPIPPGGYVDRTVTATGQFGCDNHRYMTGRITVT